MKIKIITVGQALNPFKPQGKQYTIIGKNVTLQHLPDGVQVQSVIKTTSQKLFDLIVVGAEFEVERQEKQDQQTGQTWVSYWIDAKKNEALTGGKKPWNNYSKPRISKVQFFEFACECYEQSKLLDPNNPDKLFGFILGTGANTVDFEAKQESTQKSENNTNAQKVQEAFGDQNDSEIPF